MPRYQFNEKEYDKMPSEVKDSWNSGKEMIITKFKNGFTIHDEMGGRMYYFIDKEGKGYKNGFLKIKNTIRSPFLPALCVPTSNNIANAASGYLYGAVSKAACMTTIALNVCVPVALIGLAVCIPNCCCSSCFGERETRAPMRQYGVNFSQINTDYEDQTLTLDLLKKIDLEKQLNVSDMKHENLRSVLTQPNSNSSNNFEKQKLIQNQRERVSIHE